MMEKPIERHFQEWESDVFGFGYGSGEEHVLGAVKAFLGAVGTPDSARSYNYEILEKAVGPVTCWLLINTFGHQSLIEYGTSPRYGWLTEQGEALRDFFMAHTIDELVDFTNLPDPDYCWPGGCNCGPTGYVDGGKKLCHNPFWVEQKQSSGNKPGEA